MFAIYLGLVALIDNYNRFSQDSRVLRKKKVPVGNVQPKKQQDPFNNAVVGNVASFHSKRNDSRKNRRGESGMIVLSFLIII